MLRLAAFVLLISGCIDPAPSAVDGAMPAPKYVLRGVVTGGGRPLAGALVHAQGAREPMATTGVDGHFTLELPGAQAGDHLAVTAGGTGWQSALLAAVLPDRAVTVDLAPIPADHGDGELVSAVAGKAACKSCHPDHFARWSTSQHARAAVDPIVLDEYRVFAAWWQRVPHPETASEARAFAGPILAADRKGDTGSFFTEYGERYKILGDDGAFGICARCHSPAFALAGGVDFRGATSSTVGAEGVTCDLCHKVKSIRLDNPEQFASAGIDKLTFARPGRDASFTFGQFDDVDPTRMPSSYLPLLTESSFCAACHEDARTMRLQHVDSAGRPLGAPVVRQIWGEDTWREWRFLPGAFGVKPINAGVSYDATGDGPFVTGKNYAGVPLQCQDCHMQDPPGDSTTGEAIADWSAADGNSAQIADPVQSVTRDRRTVYPHRFSGRSPRFIAWATELSAHARRDRNQLIVDVTVENRHTGHRFPSGLPDRNAILLVEARDANGPLRLLDGPKIPAWASGDGRTDHARDYAGLPGHGYARVLAGADGEAPVFYLRAVRQSENDNRLLPGQRDDVQFRFAASGSPITVTARIVHRLRFKSQSDRYLRAHPGADPAEFETPGDLVTLDRL